MTNLLQSWTSLAVALAILCSATSTAVALPPPMSPADLEKNSDFVGTIKVLNVVCVGPMPYRGKGPETNAYQACLQVQKVEKGKVPVNATVLVQWQSIPPRLLGPWAVAYYPGAVVRTHLKWNDNARVYDTTWWNAVTDRIEQPKNQTLPNQPGEVAVAPTAKAN